MDKLSPEQRSLLMAKVKSQDTQPELIARKLIFSLGYRYRLYRADLPGKPDLVFPGRRKVIFIHGCFWHRHQGCKHATTPQSRRDYWDKKFARTIQRDQENLFALKSLGWKSLVIWECQLRDTRQLEKRISAFLK